MSFSFTSFRPLKAANAFDALLVTMSPLNPSTFSSEQIFEIFSSSSYDKFISFIIFLASSNFLINLSCSFCVFIYCHVKCFQKIHQPWTLQRYFYCGSWVFFSFSRLGGQVTTQDYCFDWLPLLRNFVCLLCSANPTISTSASVMIPISLSSHCKFPSFAIFLAVVQVLGAWNFDS